MPADKPICVLTETDWVPDDVIERLERVFDVRKGPFSTEELIKEMQHATCCFVGLDHIIEKCMFGPKLLFVASPTTGLNHIDLEHAKKHDVKIISLKGESAFLEKITATAELCWGLIISLRRGIPEAATSVKEGHWDRNRVRGKELNESILGIIGYGRLGQKLAKYALAFNMKILVNTPQEINDPEVEFCELETLLRKSDIVSLQVDSRPENYHMLGTKEFKLMKKSAVFINTARGDLIDEAALLDALKNKTISGAALDVIEEEFDIGHSSQDLIAYARNHRNLIITPHIGGATYESQHKAAHFILEKLLNYWNTHDST